MRARTIVVEKREGGGRGGGVAGGRAISAGAGGGGEVLPRDVDLDHTLGLGQQLEPGRLLLCLALRRLAPLHCYPKRRVSSIRPERKTDFEIN